MWSTILLAATSFPGFSPCLPLSRSKGSVGPGERGSKGYNLRANSPLTIMELEHYKATK